MIKSLLRFSWRRLPWEPGQLNQDPKNFSLRQDFQQEKSSFIYLSIVNWINFWNFVTWRINLIRYIRPNLGWFNWIFWCFPLACFHDTYTNMIFSINLIIFQWFKLQSRLRTLSLPPATSIIHSFSQSSN